jgi:hypothetical protein
MDQSLVLHMPELIQSVDPVAAEQLLFPEKDRGDSFEGIVKKVSKIVMGNDQNAPLQKLRDYYSGHSQSVALDEFNKWLIDESHSEHKIPVGKKWKDLDRNQQIYYGVYVQVKKKLDFVHGVKGNVPK